jgi:hypothetical protein
VKERTLLNNACYVIPIREKLIMHARRLVLIPYLILRYKMRRFIPTDMENPGDVVRKYVRDYEAEKVLRALGIEERDSTAAVKATTYMHNLTHPLGEITEMTLQRSMRIEKHCPFARHLSPDTCKDLLSGPAFRGLCEAIHPNLVHTHTKYLSGGDDCCDLAFELKD